MSECRINEVIYDEKSCRPVIVNFTNGKLLPGNENKFACSMFQNSSGKFFPAISTDKILHTSEIKREDELFNTFIAIRDKKTNEMRLVAVDSTILETQTIKQREIIAGPKMEYRESTLALNRAFGSKQARRRAEQIERLNCIGVNNDELDEITNDKNSDEAKTTENDMQRPVYLPPINKNAKTVDEVYPLEELIPSSILSALKDSAEEALKSTIEEMSLQNEYIKQEVMRRKSYPLDKALKEVEILIYLDGLLNIMLTPAQKIAVKSYSPCGSRKDVSTHILDNFTLKTARARVRPLTMKEKCNCYIIVLAATINNYTLNLEDLNVPMKIGIKKLIELCRLLQFSFDAKQKQAELKLPLPEVSLEKKFKAKKRRAF